MKYYNVMLLSAVLLFLVSCSKSSSTDNVTYEVKITAGTWSGDYFDYAGGNQSLKMIENQPTGWKYSFSLPHGTKADLVLSAIPNNGDSVTTAIANIYLNGKVIATDTSFDAANAQIIINQ